MGSWARLVPSSRQEKFIMKSAYEMTRVAGFDIETSTERSKQRPSKPNIHEAPFHLVSLVLRIDLFKILVRIHISGLLNRFRVQDILVDAFGT